LANTGSANSTLAIRVLAASLAGAATSFAVTTTAINVRLAVVEHLIFARELAQAVGVTGTARAFTIVTAG
jgi:hypothetical protein